MRKFLLSCALFLSSSIALAQAADDKFIPKHLEPGKIGIGMSVGEADGLSLMYQKNEHSAVQGMMSVGEDNHFVSADYLFLRPNTFNTGVAVPYVGVGAMTKKSPETMGEDVYGVRMPVGMNINLPNMPVQLGGEIAPTMTVHPHTASSMQAQMHVRLMLQ